MTQDWFEYNPNPKPNPDSSAGGWADETFVRVDGRPDSPPLVLVHGVGLDHTMWDAVTDGLAAHHLVIRYDLLGHGSTPDRSGPRGLEHFVEQLVGVVDRYELVSPVVAGLSIGGLITMAAAARHRGRFGRIALLNTVFDPTLEQRAGSRTRLALTEAEGMAPVADLAIDRWFTREWQIEHPTEAAAVHERLRTNDLDAYLKAYRVFIAGDPLMPEGAGAIDCPVFAMTGSLDPGSIPDMTYAMAAAVPDGEALILEGLHHIPPIEAPVRFTEALLQGLKT